MVTLRLMRYSTSPRPEIIAHVAQSNKHRQFRYPSKIYLDEVYWDQEKEYCKSIHPSYRHINEMIDMFRDSVIDAYSLIMKNREPIENLTDYVVFQQSDPMLMAPPREKERRLQKIMLQYMNELSLTDVSASKIEYARRSLYTYMRTIGHERIDIALSPDSIDLYLGFMRQGRFGQLANGTLQNILKEIKLFLEYVNDLGYVKTKESLELIANQRKKYRTVDAVKYSVTPEMIQSLMSLDRLYSMEKFCRDLFVFACMTGMRISDVHNLKIKDIKIMSMDDGSHIEYAEIVHIKKNRRTLHPINDIASTIINRWAQGNPDDFIFQHNPYIPPSTVNRKIKTLLKMTGLCNHMVPVNKLILGKTVRTMEPFYKVISTHNGRISFAGFYMDNGGNLRTLQKIFDHKVITTTIKYLPDKSKEQGIKESGVLVNNFVKLI